MSYPFSRGVALLAACFPAVAAADTAKAPVPTAIFDTTVPGMPSAEQQQIRVLSAEVGPGQMTIHHTHPFPVTTYVLDGAMTFAIDGQDPVTVTAGQVFVEPSGTPITGANNGDIAAHVVMFYVSDPATPFLSHLN
jgi:quercetin dioxygenase-like cupin family protein